MLFRSSREYLFFVSLWSYEEIGFTFNTGVHAAADGVISPAIIQIVCHMSVSVSDPAFSIFKVSRTVRC
ncbi:hypothetical protein QJS10_CPA01g00026 [Acorus calamus]|uniref:Uncharacterized protein n=1 Tax=Acorus calamus TaxID=4465 RepID=A0AAV9FIY1_ACOCL|nr:hypothetical protein QJS10_CPA01g00026 [Acorus calamus]